MKADNTEEASVVREDGTGRPPPLYDGVAEWYDAQLETAPHRHRTLRRHLPRGSGPCLDVGSGTGRDLPVIEEHGWTAIGIELSGDQLRLARTRGGRLVRGDAERLPFRAGAFPLVVASWISTDVEHWDRVLVEVSRVLEPAGHFLFWGVHPCFNGPHVESTDDGQRIIHPSYRRAERHRTAPWWGQGGIRQTVGGMRHVPLTDFLNAFVDAGLMITRVAEPDDDAVPHALVVHASRP